MSFLFHDHIPVISTGTPLENWGIRDPDAGDAAALQWHGGWRSFGCSLGAPLAGCSRGAMVPR